MTPTSRSQLDKQAEEILGFSRWWQVVAAAIMMALVSPYQYVWSSIEGPLAAQLDVSLPSLAAVFTLFVIFQAGSQFPVGWWRDRHGPRQLILVAGVLAGGGYVGLAYATELWQVYVLYSLGAIGVGIVYTVAVNTALKWFPDRRGLTTGIGTMAFAGGSAIAVPFIRAYATPTGYPVILRNGGLIIGIGILVGAIVLRDPPSGWLKSTSVVDKQETKGDTEDFDPEAKQFTWREMLRTRHFWIMYVMFVAVSGTGLMLTANIVSFSETQGFTAAIATVSATILPIASGAGRLLIGGLSDRVDREYAMAISFTLCGIGTILLTWVGGSKSSVAFVTYLILAIFFWSPQYTLFPSIIGDYYGREYSSTNYALLYTGKMWGGIFGGAVTGWLVVQTDWTTTFLVGGGLAILAGIGALSLRSLPSIKRDRSAIDVEDNKPPTE